MKRNSFGLLPVVMITTALASSSARAGTITVDADAAVADNQDIGTFFTGVTLAAISPNGSVFAEPFAFAITGTRVFGWNNQGFDDQHWARPSSPDFSATFGFLANRVSIDYRTDIGGTLLAYDANGVQLGSDSDPGHTGTFTFTAAAGNVIKSIVVRLQKAGGNDFGTLDHLVIGTAGTPPAIGKSFAAVSIGVNNTTRLTFTLSNPDSTSGLTGLQFSDALPTGLVVATPAGLNGACGGGTITALAGSNLITLTSAALAPKTSCAFSVNVTANGVALGLLTNTTSTVTSNEAQPGAAAQATIFVGDPFQVSYAANLSIGDSFIDITNAGSSIQSAVLEVPSLQLGTAAELGAAGQFGALLQPAGAAGVAGSICANVYAFSADEQLLSCCSCPITPNALVSFSARNDLSFNVGLTPSVPTAIVVKVLATLPAGGTCNNSAAFVTSATLANGMKAFGSTIHAAPSRGVYGVTETPFSVATLSAGELSRIGNLCNFILANGSGFGVCRTCRLGGL